MWRLYIPEFFSANFCSGSFIVCGFILFRLVVNWFEVWLLSFLEYNIE